MAPKLTRIGWWLMVLCLLSASTAAQWQDMAQTEVRGHIMYTVFEPDEIPAILEPHFISVLEAQKLYHPDEPLIVVGDGPDTHAYSLWHLEEHIVVNDYINGRSITATW